ncbi:MAG TPA: beta-galactosidase [Bryobacteraceae bacterium]|nr:beta-galactosidase [Bryobacteraceae bacterium]
MRRSTEAGKEIVRGDTDVRLISGIDTAMPDVQNTWSNHAQWNQNTYFWREDFQHLASCGFDLIRWQMPWSLVEPKPGQYRWDLIDPKVELATKLGVEIFYPIVHFNLPSWLAMPGERHSVLSSRLADRTAKYTDALLSRYHFRLVIPVVEVQMDACQRGLTGNWQPHFKSQVQYRTIHTHLVKAFKAGAAVARHHGATVFCSEPAPALETVLQLSDSFDIAGIDLYPHLHRQRSVVGWFRHWWKTARKPLCISEFGTPESYDPSTRIDDYGKFFPAGMETHRIKQAIALRQALAQARSENIPIPFGGWYPGTGNIGWGQCLTEDRTGLDCDRAGLVDLARQQDGTLKRVLCRGLVEEILAIRDLPAARQSRWAAA